MKMKNTIDISDPEITEMDLVRKMWLYSQWLGDHRDDAELAKNHAYLLGSFSNPEAVKEMLNNNVHESTDEDMEESMRMVKDTDVMMADNLILPDEPIKRRRRKNTIRD
jgi:hypothetical protein